MADFILSVLSAAARPPCVFPKIAPLLWEGIEERMLGLFASDQSVFTACCYRSFSASCQEESEDKELQSSEGSHILHLGTELCRVLSSSAWICGRSSSPLLCILNMVGDYFNAFNQIFDGFYFSVKSAQRGWYVLSKSHALSNAVCVSNMIQKSPQSDCR